MGFTTSVLVGVWIGEDQPATIGKNGRSIQRRHAKLLAQLRGVAEVLAVGGVNHPREAITSGLSFSFAASAAASTPVRRRSLPD